MSLSQFTSPWDSDTDANFRAWGSQLSAQLAAIGLTQTADTGQINWSTVTIVGSYAQSVGYEIWKFNDSLAGSSPIVFRIDYGAASAQVPSLELTLGTGSNGAGVITGATKSIQQTLTDVAQSTTNGAAYPSWLCYNPALGFLGIAFKVGGLTSGYGSGFIINRTNDTAGNPTGDGFNCWAQNNPGTAMQGYFQNPGQGVALPPGGAGTFGTVGACNWPYSLTSSYANGETQALPMLQMQPAIQVAANMCCVIASEVPLGTTFSLNVVGLTPRTFLCIGKCFGNVDAHSNGNYSLCMLYQ